MSRESLQATASSMTADQVTAGMVIGLQWAAQYVDDELSDCFADEAIDRCHVQTLEIVREWLVKVSNGMVRGEIQIGQSDVGSIHD